PAGRSAVHLVVPAVGRGAMSGMTLFDEPGPRARRRHLMVTVLSLAAVAVGSWWVLDQLAKRGNLDAERWRPFLTAEIWTEYLLPGIRGTITAAAVAIVLALVFGVLFGVGRLSRHALIRRPCGVVVEFFRSVPVLMMMLFAYGAFDYTEAVPPEHLSFAAVVAGLVPYNGSVVAELVRSGVSGLPRGQAEAGRAVGLTETQLMRSVLLPQALTAMLPSLVSQLVVVLKDTALGYIVSYEELLRKAEQIGTYQSNLIPALIVVAVIYVAMNIGVTQLAGRIERRLGRRRQATRRAAADVSLDHPQRPQ
ncbi:MAG: amino acid ABC transporter permease, partial [Angustibacter sp.]